MSSFATNRAGKEKLKHEHATLRKDRVAQRAHCMQVAIVNIISGSVLYLNLEPIPLSRIYLIY
jgi:hypothetical protein